MQLIVCITSYVKKHELHTKYLGFKQIWHSFISRKKRIHQKQRKIVPRQTTPTSITPTASLKLPPPHSIHEYINDVSVVQQNPSLDFSYTLNHSMSEANTVVGLKKSMKLSVSEIRAMAKKSMNHSMSEINAALSQSMRLRSMEEEYSYTDTTPTPKKR